MKSQLFDIRREYKKGRLTPGNLNDNPLEQFDHWLNDAIHSDEYEPTAMTVATASTDGHPSTRTVLLKGVENGRFIFFTNYESRKGRQLTANPYISLSFVWHKLERQIHIEGKLKDALLPILTPILQADLTKVKSGRGFHPKVTSLAAVWR